MANRFVGDAEPYGFAVNLCVSDGRTRFAPAELPIFFCIKIKMRREQAPPHFEHINFKFLKAFPFRQPYSVYNIL